MLTVEIAFADGFRQQEHAEFSNLLDACRGAFDIANGLGSSLDADHGAPHWVRVLRNGELEISIAVVPGGLLSSSV